MLTPTMTSATLVQRQRSSIRGLLDRLIEADRLYRESRISEMPPEERPKGPLRSADDAAERLGH